MEKTNKQRSFRPWPDNEKRLEQASKVGFNVSELVNEILRDNFDKYVLRKCEEITKAIR